MADVGRRSVLKTIVWKRSGSDFFEAQAQIFCVRRSLSEADDLKRSGF